MNRRFSLRQTGSLSRQLSQRVLSLGVVAISGLLALVAVGLIASFQITQNRLNLARDTAHATFIEFLGGLNNDLLATSDALITTRNADDLFFSTLERQPAIFELDYISAAGRVLNQRRRVGQAETSFAEQPWLETVKSGKTYIGSVDYAEFGVPFVRIAVPVTDRDGNFKGTLLAITDLTALWRPIINLKVGETGYVYITDASGQLLAYKDLQLVQSGFKLTGSTPQSVAQGNINIYPGISGTVIASGQSMDIAPWFVIVEQPLGEALRTFIWVLVALMFLLVFVVLQASSMQRFTRQRVVEPLGLLQKGVKELESSGRLEHPIVIETKDELGDLANTFNSMAAQLGELIGTLESRVADRTKALATSTEVSRRLSTILNQNELVSEVVNQVNKAFGYYHTQIYFFDESNQNLVMAGGTGEAGEMMLAQFHKIAKGQGLVGRAAENNEPILVSDTANNPDWLPNVLLPETKSEAAIPISLGDTVLGVLDVQHNIVDGLKREDIDALQSIANQVAVAIQNARSYSKTWEAQQLTRNVIDSTDDWIFIKDQDHRYQLVNQGYANSLHIPIADFIGRNDLELGFPEELVKGNPEKGIRGFWADDRSVMDGGVTRQIPDDLVTIDGNIHVFDTVKVPLRDADNKVWGVLAFARDMTERRSLEEINRKRAFQQEAINMITQKIQGTTSIKMALQITARELGHALGMKSTLVALDQSALAGDGKNKVSKESVK